MLLLAIIAQLFVPAVASAQVRALPSPEDLNATVEKSIVQIRIGWAGYVLYSTAQGYTWSGPVETYSSCSGFFVTPTGHIMTAGHCVQPDMARESVIEAFLTQQVRKGTISAADAGALLPDALMNWKVEGKTAGSPVTRLIQVVQPKGVEGAVLEDPVNAQLVDFRPFAEGDLALLKVEVTDAVPLPVAQQDPKSGAALTAVGFPGSVNDVVDPGHVRASFKTGTASSAQVSPEGVPQIEVNADISGGMSGGPTVDAQGNALGVNSFTVVGEEQAFNFITDTTDLRDWLGGKGLQLAPAVSALQTEPTSNGAVLPGPSAADSSRELPTSAWTLIATAALIAVAAVTSVAVIRARRQRSQQPQMAGAGVTTQQWGHPVSAAWGSAPESATRQSWMPMGGQHQRSGQEVRVPDAHCANCGSILSREARFCGTCGSPAR